MGSSFLLSFLALFIGFRSCAGSGWAPGLPYDRNTIHSCLEWYDNDEGKTCEQVRDYFKITPEQFFEWNPSIGLDCKPWKLQSYCIVTLERVETDPPKPRTKCEDTCYRAQFDFAGVKEGNECWCSSYVAGERTRNETDCNKPCTGDKTKMCGSKDLINVFAPDWDSTSELNEELWTEADGTTKAESKDAIGTAKVEAEGEVVSAHSSSSGGMRYRALFQ
ncbi:WSC domain-containing protein [Fusarium sp. LHS14.1]|nr:WSC domain-containing protein [Fusarium sp. LHS14.1]